MRRRRRHVNHDPRKAVDARSSIPAVSVNDLERDGGWPCSESGQRRPEDDLTSLAGHVPGGPWSIQMAEYCYVIKLHIG